MCRRQHPRGDPTAFLHRNFEFQFVQFAVGRDGLAAYRLAVDDDFDRHFAVNVRAPFFLTQAALPSLRAGEAPAVVNVSSSVGSMVKPGTTCLGAEYFCFEGDEIWEMPDDEIVRLTTDELARIGLVDPKTVVDGVKVYKRVLIRRKDA